MSSTLSPLTDGIWTYDYELRMGPGALLPCRSTLIRVDDESLVLVSPGPLAEDDVTAIRELGTVSWVIAPNLFHHLYLLPAAAALGAKIMGPRGLNKKQPELSLDAILGQDPLPKGLEGVALEGQKRLREHVFYHPASRTLIATDLLFNLNRPPGFWSRVAFSIFGTYQGPAVSRLVKFATEDAGAFKSSVAQVLAFDFNCMLMAHGAPITDDARSVLRTAAEKRFGALPSA